jgi:hypothetical protein
MLPQFLHVVDAGIGDLGGIEKGDDRGRGQLLECLEDDRLQRRPVDVALGVGAETRIGSELGTFII